LATCFDETLWSDNRLIERTTEGGELADALCGLPREPQPSDFCTDN